MPCKKKNVRHIGYRNYYCEGIIEPRRLYGDSFILSFLKEQKAKKSVIKKFLKERDSIRQDWEGSWPCFYTNRFYVFWQKRKTAYIKRFDDCGESCPARIKYSSIFGCPDEYIELLKKEELKGFMTDSFWFGGSYVNLDMSEDDGCNGEILLMNNGDSLFRRIDFFDLDSIFGNYRNINYKENSNLRIVAWDRQLASIIADLERRRKIKQQK